eukprot:5754506-Pleurochrysis_carterae.AAC.1
MIPELGKYVEEGVTGNLPSPTRRLKFTASQSRHWVEHGTVIMEGLLQRKVRSSCHYSCALMHARTPLPIARA